MCSGGWQNCPPKLGAPVVSRSIIKQLDDLTTKLERRQRPAGVLFLSHHESLDSDVVLAKHYELYPEDKSNEDDLIVMRTVFERHPGAGVTEPPSQLSRETAAWAALTSGASP